MVCTNFTCKLTDVSLLHTTIAQHASVLACQSKRGSGRHVTSESGYQRLITGVATMVA